MAVAVVTGTSSGIGLAVSKRLAANGYRVYAGVRDLDTTEMLRNAIVEADGSISLLKIDVSDESSINEAIDHVLTNEDRIDVLVNNAGISRGNALEDTSMDDVREVFETNFFGLVAVTKKVGPHMRERGGGTIVNVGSMVGRFVGPTGTYYAASKYAVEAFSESLAMQMLPHNVRVAIIEPGMIPTSIVENSQKAQPGTQPNPLYAKYSNRVAKLFATMWSRPNATTVEDAADVIEHAIKTDDPKLRYTVGHEADDLILMRQKMSDEEYIRFLNIEDDDEFFDTSKKLIGYDLYRGE